MSGLPDTSMAPVASMPDGRAIVGVWNRQGDRASFHDWPITEWTEGLRLSICLIDGTNQTMPIPAIAVIAGDTFFVDVSFAKLQGADQ